jgi:hypothetical protein
VMVDQLWMWIIKGSFDPKLSIWTLVTFQLNVDVLITSFPQTWGQANEDSTNHDFLAKLVEYIRGPREDAFCSVEDLAVTILKRCSTIFTLDASLLLPDPLLLEIYQEAIGSVVSIFQSNPSANTATNLIWSSLPRRPPFLRVSTTISKNYRIFTQE